MRAAQAALLAVLLGGSTLSRADDPRLVAVLPLDVANAQLKVADRVGLEESVRTIAGDVLTPAGYRVLTGETTLAVLRDNGVEANRACETSCALEAARELKAQLFISGIVTTSEGTHLAFVRLFESGSGAQLSSVRLSGRTVAALLAQFEERAPRLFAAVATAPPESAPPPPPSGGPVVRKGAATQPVADLTIAARPSEGARLEITSPDGRRFVSASPYRNAQAQPGRWQATAQLAGHAPVLQEFDVPADDATFVKLELRRTGALKITGTPVGAAVRVTGNGFSDEGGLPWEATGMNPADYEIKVTRAGYVHFAQTAAVRPGETTEVAVTLLKEAAPASDMVPVPGGTFVMGTNVGGFSDEKPATEVTLAPFWMDRTEVTQAAYKACVDAGRCMAPPGFDPEARPRHPVARVSWEEARAYCEWMQKRLPTEAEWEYAARGSDGRPYPWGETSPTCRLAVMKEGGPGCGTGGTQPVGSRPEGASPFGLLDMSGNVFEWVADWRGEYYGSPQVNPTGPAKGTGRVFRGGGFEVTLAPATFRVSNAPTHRDGDLGFRCARGTGGR